MNIKYKFTGTYKKTNAFLNWDKYRIEKLAMMANTFLDNIIVFEIIITARIFNWLKKVEWTILVEKGHEGKHESKQGRERNIP